MIPLIRRNWIRQNGQRGNVLTSHDRVVAPIESSMPFLSDLKSIFVDRHKTRSHILYYHSQLINYLHHPLHKFLAHIKLHISISLFTYLQAWSIRNSFWTVPITILQRNHATYTATTAEAIFATSSESYPRLRLHSSRIILDLMQSIIFFPWELLSQSLCFEIVTVKGFE